MIIFQKGLFTLSSLPSWPCTRLCICLYRDITAASRNQIYSSVPQIRIADSIGGERWHHGFPAVGRASSSLRLGWRWPMLPRPHAQWPWKLRREHVLRQRLRVEKWCGGAVRYGQDEKHALPIYQWDYPADRLTMPGAKFEYAQT
jgi:hypothetical protein